MPSSSKFIPMVLSCLLMISMAASAKADVIENLVFTGTATCVDSTCGVGTNATLTGTFTVDLSSGLPVNLDAWSFTSTSSILGGTGTISSADPGASYNILYTSTPAATVDQFIIDTSTPDVFEYVQLYFTTASPDTEIGSVLASSPTIDYATQSSVCVNGDPSAGHCEQTYTVTGSTALVPTPEPSSVILLLTTLLAVGFVARKRIAQGL